MALPAFARRTPAVQQSIDIACISKFTAAVCYCGPMMGQTDGQTDTVPLHRPWSAYYAGSANEGVITGG